ncbi:MAG TPA: adenosine kinase [Alphaproteobacteria bacterium]|nr:adenosine kinase [Alphaproteobacteria bacterium]
MQKNHQRRFDVLGIGNAIVDILSHANEDFLNAEAIQKGVMTLIDDVRADALYKKMGPATIVSGGSAANTMAGLAGLGGSAAYIGRVHNDQLGKGFSHDLKASGVHYATPPAMEGAPTASCLIFITPDGQRSMNTFLGASTDLSASELDEELSREAAVTYLEGYLFDKPPAQAAFRQAAEQAHRHGNKVALSLSDPFCVNRHRQAFQELVEEGVDILFANENEACSLYQRNDLKEVIPLLSRACDLAIVTRSEKGSLILQDGEPITVAPEKVARVVDSTGAGDLYASGFLFGYTRGLPLEKCGRMGSVCAAEVISHVGPRPQADLKKLLQSKGLV